MNKRKKKKLNRKLQSSYAAEVALVLAEVELDLFLYGTSYVGINQDGVIHIDAQVGIKILGGHYVKSNMW